MTRSWAAVVEAIDQKKLPTAAAAASVVTGSWLLLHQCFWFAQWKEIDLASSSALIIRKLSSSITFKISWTVIHQLKRFQWTSQRSSTQSLCCWIVLLGKQKFFGRISININCIKTTAKPLPANAQLFQRWWICGTLKKRSLKATVAALSSITMHLTANIFSFFLLL